ncbi:RING/U-box superfamily protein [Euphorbia peplus]|nr:RING/U-box superfamily protein [Euphorbia peplus]
MERRQNNSSSDFSPTFYMNYSSNANNQSHPIPIIDPFSNQAMVWPSQAAAIANRHTATPFQDLLADAIADQSPPHSNNQAPGPFPSSLAQDGTHPHPEIQAFPFHQPNISQVQAFHQNIDLNEAIENHPGIEGNQNTGAGAHLNPFSNNAFNSTQIAISAGTGGNVVLENSENGGRFAYKRPSPEESSRESTQSIGESSRTRSRSEDEEDDEDFESDDSDGHYVIRRVRTGGARVINHSAQRWNPSSGVLGLAATAAAERQEHALRNRIMARARQMAEEDSRIRRHIRLRRAMHPTTRHLRELAAADIPEEPQSPQPQPAVVFPFEPQMHPGFIHPSPPPLQMQLPIPPPNFANYGDNTNVQLNWNWSHGNFNRHAQVRPYASPAGTTTYTLNGGETVTSPLERSNNSIRFPHQMMQRGSLEQMLTNLNVITNSSPGSNIASSSNSNNAGSIYPHTQPHVQPIHMVPQGNMVDQYGQQLIPMHQNAAMTEAQARANYCLQHLGIPVMSPGQLVPTHQAVPAPRQTAIQLPHEVLMRAHAAAQRRSRQLFSEVRNALALVRRGGSLQLEDVMVVDGSVVYADDHEDMRLDVDDMSYEELLDLEESIGSVSTGLSDAAIHAHMKHFKYKTVAIGSSSQGHPCCICQEEFTDGEDLGKLECGHDFHYNCIRQWLVQKNNCPICKMTGLHI